MQRLCPEYRRNDKECNGCGKKGHVMKNCWMKDKECYKCKDKGHLANMCNERKQSTKEVILGNRGIEEDNLDIISAIVDTECKHPIIKEKIPINIENKGHIRIKLRGIKNRENVWLTLKETNSILNEEKWKKACWRLHLQFGHCGFDKLQQMISKADFIFDLTSVNNTYLQFIINSCAVVMFIQDLPFNQVIRRVHRNFNMKLILLKICPIHSTCTIPVLYYTIPISKNLNLFLNIKINTNYKQEASRAHYCETTHLLLDFGASPILDQKHRLFTSRMIQRLPSDYKKLLAERRTGEQWHRFVMDRFAAI
ncbi:hypothetical protein Anas_13330 [Armadillidium nasatum]|uniref:CCHC-type domain-containing protein n=1 Tax=Armadillidium nasatum TaxID=96803 RepID=A0A5N5T696_9CRUS|nr:hypothetical protein Anas_13330 [Armadillidium nasatum]